MLLFSSAAKAQHSVHPPHQPPLQALRYILLMHLPPPPQASACKYCPPHHSPLEHCPAHTPTSMTASGWYRCGYHPPTTHHLCADQCAQLHPAPSCTGRNALDHRAHCESNGRNAPNHHTPPLNGCDAQPQHGLPFPSHGHNTLDYPTIGTPLLPLNRRDTPNHHSPPSNGHNAPNHHAPPSNGHDAPNPFIKWA